MTRRPSRDPNEFQSARPNARPHEAKLERLEAAFEAMAQGVIGIDAQGRITDWNPAMARACGQPAEKVLGTPLADWVDSSTPPLHEVLGQRAPIEHLEFLVRQSDGGQAYFTGKWLPIAAASDGGVLVVNDRTKRKWTEQMLAIGAPTHSPMTPVPAYAREFAGQTELILALLADLPAGLCYFDADLTYRLVNPVYAAIFGKSPEFFIGKHFFDLFPGYQAEVQKMLERAAQTEQNNRFSVTSAYFPFPDEHGVRDTYWDFTYSMIRDEQGELEGVLVICFEVSERVILERKLIRHTELLEEAQRIAHIGSWELDLESGQFTYSRELCRIFGCDAEAEPRSVEWFRSRIHPDEQEEHAASIDAARRDGSSFEFDRRISRPDGEERIVHVSGKVLRSPEGRPRKMLGITRDVTRERRSERLKSEFISTVSHELRTPLSSLRGTLHMLTSGLLAPDSPQWREMLAIADRNTKRMTRLVNDLLDLQRLSSGRLSIQPQPVEACDLAHQTEELMSPLARDAGVEVHVRCTPAPVVADFNRIMQVLTNLVDNAIAFSPRGGAIDIVIAPEDDAVRFEIHDEGPGIPSEELEAIFEPFHQVDGSATRRKGGTGLGLAISKGIIERHHGRIWASSRQSRGSSFIFTLPSRLDA